VIIFKTAALCFAAIGLHISSVEPARHRRGAAICAALLANISPAFVVLRVASPLSFPAKARNPVRRAVSAQAFLPLEYWITRLVRTYAQGG